MSFTPMSKESMQKLQIKTEEEKKEQNKINNEIHKVAYIDKMVSNIYNETIKYIKNNKGKSYTYIFDNLEQNKLDYLCKKTERQMILNYLDKQFNKDLIIEGVNINEIVNKLKLLFTDSNITFKIVIYEKTPYNWIDLGDISNIITQDGISDIGLFRKKWGHYMDIRGTHCVHTYTNNCKSSIKISITVDWSEEKLKPCLLCGK